MSIPQTFPVIDPRRLIEAVASRKQDGWRLVQIGATRLPEQVELTYSFDRALELANLRLLQPMPDAHVPSITGVYGCAFLYENEIHDLFGVTFDGLAVDFHGALYKTAVPYPLGAPPRLKPTAPTRPATIATAPGATANGTPAT